MLVVFRYLVASRFEANIAKVFGNAVIVFHCDLRRKKTEYCEFGIGMLRASKLP